MKNNRFLVLVIGFLLIVSVVFAATSPQVINFQGYITDKNGSPVFGTRQMSFDFCSDKNGTVISGISTDATKVRTVTVYNGNYSTKLVLTNADYALLSSNDVWLKVYVGGQAMSPLIQMVAVPFAGNVRGISMDQYGTAKLAGEVIGTQLNGSQGIYGQFRMVNEAAATPRYGSFFRNDNADTYLLLTDSGSPYGTWNALRPFTVHNATGFVTIANGVSISGGASTISGATITSSTLNASTITFSKSIYLPATGYDGAGQIQCTGRVMFANSSSAVSGVNLNNLLVSDAWADTPNVPVNGIYSKGNINSGGYVYAAAWNDLAEVRALAKGVKKVPGKVYVMTEEGLKLATQRCEIGTVGICSDTFGFSLGGKDLKEEQKAQIAISGWVLAYVDKKYPLGTALTSGPNGILTAMTKQEKRDYPERIVGILDTKPEKYNNIKVDGRYWVKVK